MSAPPPARPGTGRGASASGRRTVEALVEAIGKPAWQARVAELREAAASRTHSGRRVLQYHCIELALERARPRNQASAPPRAATEAERLIATYAAATVHLLQTAGTAARERLLTMLRAAVAPGGTLVPVFHLVRTAGIQRDRGFAVHFAGLEDDASFDLLIERGGREAEIACDVFSAENGRGVHRGAWFDLVDRVDPELQTWLRAHPGRYLLKLTLPGGLRQEGETLASLHARIAAMLATSRRADGDAAAVLRLDPLLLAAAQSDVPGLMPRLREEFGPEAHLAVVAAGGGVFVMAARAGTENEVAAAVRRRLLALAPARLTGTRPGIVALFLEDTDRAEWTAIRDRLELEGETRQFMTTPEAGSVVCVTCATRLELFGLPEPGSAPGGELRFRNPAHKDAKLEALLPAISSSM